MPRSQFLIAVGGTLGGLAVLMGLAGIAFEPILAFAAVPFMISGYIIWYHGTGRMEFRTRVRADRARAEEAAFQGGRRREADGGRDDGPRWTDPDWRRQWEQARRNASRARARGGRRRTPPGGERARAGTRGNRTGDRRTAVQTNSGPTPREAYRVLGLEPDSSDEAVRKAYRRKVKEVHPDTEDGDEEAFKRVTAAYETLTDRAS